jgi:uncharacterized protein YbaP (TraB family)
MTSRRLFLQQLGAAALAAALPPALQAEPLAPYDHGLLWKITLGEAPVSHLFGTLHSGDPRVLERAATVQTYIAAARVFMPELVVDADAVNTFMAASTSDSGDLPGKVGKKHWPQVSRMLALHGVDERVQPRLRPWAALVTLLQPVGGTQTTLDEVLVHGALAAGRKILPIEAVQEQIDAIARLPDATQLALLIDSARRHDAIQAGVAPMTEAWLAGDTGELSRINTRLIGDDKAMRRHADLFMQSLLGRRNALFVERLLPQIREGGVFAAFGAAHLTGPDGVLALLHRAGCITDRIA